MPTLPDAAGSPRLCVLFFTRVRGRLFLSRFRPLPFPPALPADPPGAPSCFLALKIISRADGPRK